MMKRVLGIILCDLDTKVKVKGKKAGICDGVPSTAALFIILFAYLFIYFSWGVLHKDMNT